MRKHIHHIHIIIIASVLILVIGFIAFNTYLENLYSGDPVTFGVSFSPNYARELGLNPEQTFISLLNLGVKTFRLSAYWDEIEPFNSALDKPFYFEDLDWYIDEADNRGAKVILAVGYKLPRWPECRAPEWLNDTRHPGLDPGSLSYLRQRQLKMVEVVINYYNDNPAVNAFQIENEPLLAFGHCPGTDREFFYNELNLVRSISKKPIILTDTGELRSWVTPMQNSDIFGTTIYKKVHNKFFGDLYYPIPPWFYRYKSILIRKFLAPNNEKTIIAELQSEPWANQSITSWPIDEQTKKYSLKGFKVPV